MVVAWHTRIIKHKHETTAHKMTQRQTRRRCETTATATRPNAKRRAKKVKTKPPQTRDDRNQCQTRKRNNNQRNSRWRGRNKTKAFLEDYPDFVPTVGQNWGNIQGRFTETVPVPFVEDFPLESERFPTTFQMKSRWNLVRLWDNLSDCPATGR